MYTNIIVSEYKFHACKLVSYIVDKSHNDVNMYNYVYTHIYSYLFFTTVATAILFNFCVSRSKGDSYTGEYCPSCGSCFCSCCWELSVDKHIYRGSFTLVTLLLLLSLRVRGLVVGDKGSEVREEK